MKPELKKSNVRAFSDENMISPSRKLGTVHRDSKTPINSKMTVDECSGSAIIGGREIKPVNLLLNLEKKPLECYFEGLKGKASRRRKIRQPKKKCLDFWNCDNSSATHSENWISFSAGSPLKERIHSEVDDRLLEKIIQVKTKTYEKLKEHKQENIFMKQRLAEELYLEQQANLAETWLGIIRRRSQLRNVDSENFLSCSRPNFRTSSSKHWTKIEISLLSKKFWRDDQEEQPLQKKVEPFVEDNLEEVFGEKLVFVDDED